MCRRVSLVFLICLKIIETRVSLEQREPVLTYLPDTQQYFETLTALRSKITGCKININKDLTEPQPLLVTHDSNPYGRRYLLPQNNVQGIIHLEVGQTIELHCTQGFNDTFEGTNFQVATCLYDTTLAIDASKYEITDIYCSRNSRHTTKIVGECASDGLLVEIGYEIPSIPDVNNNIELTFLKLFEVCFNIDQERTYYAHNTLTKVHYRIQSNVKRPGFIVGKGLFKSQYVNQLYSKKNQIEKLFMLLGTEAEVNAKITDKHFLTRGHLVPKADMVLGTHQLATFYFINVAPQWSTINGGNWARIEEDVRQMIVERDIVADVYTGTFGTINYSVDRKYQEFYLNFDENNNGLIPVPKIYYKAVIDRGSHTGVVLINVNNPHATLEEIGQEYIYCKDISEKIKWIKHVKQSITSGFYYACDVIEFAQVVKHLPQLNITGLLL